ncbi:MAG TPA: DoxX-like family protein, partial [Phenylobacterium sp.]
LGLPAAPAPSLPAGVGTLISAGADLLGWLGWRSPLRSTSMRVIRDGVTGDAAQAAQVLGRPAKSLPETLAAMPAGVQERWFARMWLLKAPVVAVLSGFWIASGAITLVDPVRAVAAGAAYGAAPPEGAVIAGAVLDIALGLAVLVRPTARAALAGMILTSLGYLAAGTVLAPGLWLDPLGPLVKVLPAILLAVVALAILDDR